MGLLCDMEPEVANYAQKMPYDRKIVENIVDSLKKYGLIDYEYDSIDQILVPENLRDMSLLGFDGLVIHALTKGPGIHVNHSPFYRAGVKQGEIMVTIEDMNPDGLTVSNFRFDSDYNIIGGDYL